MTAGRRDFYVYVLFDANGLPFYVGMGRKNRWKAHEAEARTTIPDGYRSFNPKKDRIVRQILTDGWPEVPKIKLHENLDRPTALSYEMALIAAIGRGKNGPLVNMTIGGDGALTDDPEQLAQRGLKISAAKKGKLLGPMSDHHKARIGLGNMGRVVSEETRRKIGNANRGRKLPPQSAEVIAKRRASLTGVPKTRQHAMKASRAWRKSYFERLGQPELPLVEQA